MKIGMIEEPNEEYHRYTGAISKSALDTFSVSPFHYWAHYLNPERPERVETPAMLFGTASHCCILEPEAFEQRYARRPDGMHGNSNAFKDWKATVERNGLIVLTGDQWDDCYRLRDAIMKNPLARGLLQGGITERSIYVTHPGTGLQIKCRPDYLSGTCVDLKSTARISASEFSKSIANHRYHVQQALYRDILRIQTGEAPRFLFLVYESDYPYSVAVYELDEEDEYRGRIAYGRELEALAEHAKHDFWPDLSEYITPIQLPGWQRNIEDAKYQ